MRVAGGTVYRSERGLGRRASVGVWIAVMFVPMLMAVSLAVEVASWEAAQVSVQRAADLAATAGGMNYLATSSNQKAATFAARMAQMNGASGTATPSWNTTNNTLTDNQVTAQIVSGYKSSSDTAILVTVQRTIQPGLSSGFTAANVYTVTGTGIAELVTVSGGTSGGQPCLLTLGTSGTTITVSGSADITGSSCVVRSDGSISLSGSSSISALAVYSAGSISTSGSAGVTGTEYTDAGTISDPYASYSPVQTALSELSAGSGSAYSLSGTSTGTISGGTYSSITLSGSSTLTLNPGLYIVNGNVNVSGSAKMNGDGVTIVASGSVTLSGSSTSSLSAPGTSPTGGAVPGFIFIGSGSGTWTFSGSAAGDLTGVVYGPNASLNYSGSSMASPTGCLEFIVKTATISGSATLSGGCSSDGAPAFGAAGSTVQSRLVH